MGSKTISLEDAAYAKLKAAKRPGESFSDVVHRLLGGTEPSFSIFRGFLDKEAAEDLATVIARLREEDIEIQRRRLASGR